MSWIRCYQNLARQKKLFRPRQDQDPVTLSNSDNFDIVSVKSQNLYKRNPGQAAGSTASKPGKTASSMTRERESSGGGSWTWFFMKFVIFGLMLTGGYVGYTIYRTRQRDRF